MDFLTGQEEEFCMLNEWATQLGDEINKAWKNGEKLRNITHISGFITQGVIRKHLRQHNLNVSQNNNVVVSSPDGKVHQAVHLLILKKGENPNEDDYPTNKEHIALEIRTTAVANVVEITEKRRTRIRNLVKDLAVVVLSERDDYPSRFKPENTRNLFTLVIRTRRFPKLNRPNIDIPAIVKKMLDNHELKKGKWTELLNSLKEETAC
jgi:hypothetical protein